MENMGSPGIIDLLIQAWKVMEFKCGSREAIENKVIWAVLHLQTKETEKMHTIKKLFQEK